MNECSINSKLWSDIPVINNSNNNFKYNGEYNDLAFPSARQALTEALIKANIKRSDRIAVPEWVTNCVISAISKVAMTIPIREVVEYSIPVTAILLYEQWGWTYLPEVKEEILEKVKAKVYILDRVDSADIGNKNSISFYPEFNEIDLRSFSKVIGLKGGGLVQYNNDYLKFNVNENDNLLCEFIFKKNFQHDIDNKLLHINKSEISALHPQLKKYISNYNFFESIKYESSVRRKNLSLIVNSKLAEDWKPWMAKSIENGTAPGIVPIFLDYSPDLIDNVVSYMKNVYKINSAIYNFNISGNPIRVDYKKCYALPIHSRISNIDLIIKDLEKFLL